MNTQPQAVEQAWLSYADVARLLSCGVRTVCRMVEQGQLPAPSIKLSSKFVRWERAVLLAHVAGMQQQIDAGAMPRLAAPPLPPSAPERKPRFDDAQTAAILKAIAEGRPVKSVAAALGVHPQAVRLCVNRERRKAASAS